MKKLVIQREAVKNNISVIKDQAGPAHIYAALTGDGLGAGLVELAQLLREEGISHFAVSEASEAEALRKAGLTEEEILMLRSTEDRGELERLLDLNVVCTVGSAGAGMALNGVAEARATIAEAHIQVNTGAGFRGFLCTEPDKILSAFRNLTNIAVSGVYTQIQAVKKNDREAALQLEQFQKAVEAVRAAGFETGTVHAAGTYALAHREESSLDGVWAGASLLGRGARTRRDRLIQACSGETSIEETRWLPKGHIVDGEKRLTLKKPLRVAVLPVGYQNGFGISPVQNTGFFGIRRAAKKPSVRINGQKAKIVGCIGAIETIVDVTNLTCTAGDAASFDIDPVHAKGFAREYREESAGKKEFL